MTGTIPNKCCLVANMPETIREWVINLRKKVDPAIAHMPVEVTLCGSSGAGTFVEGQNFEGIKTILSERLKDFIPFEFSFLSINRFPTKEIYYLEPEPESFSTLHNRIIATNLEFKEHRYPYSPHCALAGFTPITDDTRAIIEAADFPKGTYSVTSVSIYRNEKMNPVELWRYETNREGANQTSLTTPKAPLPSS